MGRAFIDPTSPAKPKYKFETIKHAFYEYIVGDVENNGQDLRAFCPLCEDPDTSNTPSATFTPEKDLFACKSAKCPSGGGMRISKLVSDLAQYDGFNIREKRLAGRARDKSVVHHMKPKEDNAWAVTEEQVGIWHSTLINSKNALDELMSKRGFTKDTIKSWHIGWDGQRYTIPVRIDGVVVNVRKYKINASSDKMRNVPGFGSARLFGYSILKRSDTVVLTEGETDCILLNQLEISAVTHTAGAATFRTQWGPEFAGKTVYVCYDNDEYGRTGALKAVKAIAPFAEMVYIMEIPLPDKGADVTDYIVGEGHSAEDFKALMATAKLATPGKHVISADAPKFGKPVTLQDSMSDEYAFDPLELRVTVAGKQNPPYTVPKKISISCQKDAGRACNNCTMFLRDGEMVVSYQPNDPDLFRLMDVPEEKLMQKLRSINNLKCRDRHEITLDEQYNMEELIVSNPVDNVATDATMTPLTRSVYSVSTYRTDPNTVVRLVGQNVRSPKDGRLSFMSWVNEPVRTSLDDFEVTEERMHLMRVFRDTSESPLDQCLKIAERMEAVTRIYGLPLLHVAYDLVWHSPLSFFAGKDYLHKGWLEAMVIGDTRTGKSEIATKLAKHYRNGVIKGCEGATFAGLVGGVQQMGNHWMTTWGVIPLNDRRLVVLDEVSGLSNTESNIIEKMSFIRSAGVAQMVKIQSEETSARTRLIWITNPKDGSMLQSKPDVGIGALRTVVKANEDIARFDFVTAVQQGDVPVEDIVRGRAEEEPFYTSDECQTLILWAWSLQPNNIHFTPAALAAAKKMALQIHKEYIADPPLLQSENARFKLYRIAAALAARTFSVRAENEHDFDLLVTDDHIIDAKRFLDMIYSASAMPYRTISQRRFARERLAVRNRSTCMQFLVERPVALNVLLAVGGTTFKTQDFSQFSPMSYAEGAQVVQDLWKMGMVERGEKGVTYMSHILFEIVQELEG